MNDMIPLKVVIEALQALKNAESYIDKQMNVGSLWCEVMNARVKLEYYVDHVLENKIVEVANEQA